MIKFVFTKNLSDYFDKNKDNIRSLFKYQGDLSQEAKKILSEIKNSESVSIHIRRGDYIALGWSVPISYQIRAAYFILEKLPNAEFFIFSDDSKYVKNYIKDTKNIRSALSSKNITPSQLSAFQEKLKNSIYVSKEVNHSLEEFYLMSECNHNIITRSIFSWWAGFLNKNPNKTVVSPTISVHKKFDGNFPKIPQNDGWVEIY